MKTTVLGTDISFEKFEKVDLELTEGVKISGTVTGDFFMINQMISMYKLKILISSLFQVPARGYRNCPPKTTEKCRHKSPKSPLHRAPLPGVIYVVSLKKG